MSRRLAIFVEGQTEQLFADRYVREIARRHDVHLKPIFRRGRQRGRSHKMLGLGELDDPLAEQTFVLINDCHGDSRVASEIRDAYNRLVEQGFRMVIGLRDLYPATRRQFRRVCQAVSRTLPRGDADTDIVLAVMEIEAWFLAEDSHFGRFVDGLGLDRIEEQLGIDLRALPVERIRHPSETLDQIYQLAGRRYDKRRRTVRHVIDSLDFRRLYEEVPTEVKSLRRLRRHLDRFFESPR